MPEQSNDALIAWLRREQDVDDPLGLEFTPEEIASALEAAEQRAEEAEAELDRMEAECTDHQGRMRDERDAAIKRAEEAERERDRLDEAFDRDLPWRYDEVEAQRNQLAAVLEKVRVYAREMRDRASMNAQQGGEFWQGMTIKGRENADDLDALIASAPADALRDVKAEAHDQGYRQAWRDVTGVEHTEYIPSQYRAREEQP